MCPLPKEVPWLWWLLSCFGKISSGSIHSLRRICPREQNCFEPTHLAMEEITPLSDPISWMVFSMQNEIIELTLILTFGSHFSTRGCCQKASVWLDYFQEMCNLPDEMAWRRVVSPAASDPTPGWVMSWNSHLAHGRSGHTSFSIAVCCPPARNFGAAYFPTQYCLCRIDICSL